MPFNNVKDGLSQLALGSSYTHGAGSITLADASVLPAAPLLLTLVKLSGYDTDAEVFRVFSISAIVGNVLTSAIASGYTDDTDFTTSDYAELRVDAQSITDLNSAVATLQANNTGTNTGDQVNITGTAGGLSAPIAESQVTGLVADLAAKAPLASPTFSGTVTVPTPATSDSSTKAASTAYVKAQGYLTAAPVISVAGRTGAVTIGSGDVSGLAASATTDTTTTGNIADSTNKRFVTDAQLAAIGNQVNITGNAATATKLTTPRAINGVNFDGSAAITIAAAAGTLTGSALASGVTSSSLTTVGTLVNLTVTNPITGSVTGNAGTATKLATARTINGVSFDGTANITITAAASPAGSSGQIQYNSSGSFAGATKLAIGSDGQLNFGALTNSSPSEGDHWSDATQHCPAIYRDGMIQYSRRLIYSQVNPVTITAQAENSILSATNAIGSLSFPAGFFNRYGRKLTISYGGYATTGASLSAAAGVFLFRLGGTVFASSVAAGIRGGVTTAPWCATAEAVAVVTGSSGALDVFGSVMASPPGGSNTYFLSVPPTSITNCTAHTDGTISPASAPSLDLTSALALGLSIKLFFSGDTMSMTITHITVEVSG